MRFAKDAVEERAVSGADGAVLDQERDLDGEAFEAVVEGPAHRRLALLPALPRDHRGRDQRTPDRAAPGRAPQPGSPSLAQEHHHLDALDATQGLGQRRDARRQHAGQDAAGHAHGHFAHALLERRPLTDEIERGGRRQVVGGEGRHVIVGREAFRQRGLLAERRVSAPVDEQPRHLRLGHGVDEGVHVVVRQCRHERGQGRHVHELRLGDRDLSQVLAADDGDAPPPVEVLG